MNEEDNRKDLDNESAFYGEKIDSNEYLQDGTYYTDEVQKVRNRRKLGVATIIAVALIFVVGLILGIRYIVFSNPEDNVIEEPTQSVTEPIETPQEQLESDYKDPNKPVTELMPETTVKSGKTTAFVEKTSLQTSDGTNIDIPNSTIQATVHECITQSPTDFCDIAQINIGEEDNAKTYQSYFLKDAVNSRFFENPENFETVEITGIPAAATMTITSLDGNATPILIAIQDNGSGFMFVSADNSIEDLTFLANQINKAE